MDAQKLRGEIIVTILLAPALWAQSTGVVEGTVVNSVTHAGIDGVTVEVTRADGPWRTSTTTDPAGRFRIAGLAPGKYRAEFAHPEFTDPQPGQTEGMSFAIGPTSEPALVRAELQPLSTLRGRLLDSDGRPMQGVRVSLQRLLHQGVYENPTDKEGRFEFVDVRPATYVLAAEPPEIDGERTVLARTYYPGVLDHRQAAPIAIPAGEELAGFEFRIATSPAFRVRGKVLDSAGRPVAGAMVELHSEDPFACLSQRFTLQDGSFEFPSVLPGSWRTVAKLYPAVPAIRQVKPAEYTPAGGGAHEAAGTVSAAASGRVETTLLNTYGESRPETGTPNKAAQDMMERAAEDYRAFIEMNKPIQKGSATFDVKHQDLDDVDIRISPPFDVAFSAVREESAGTEAKPANGSVSLDAVDPSGDSVNVTSHGGDRRFEHLFPGRYEVSIGDGEPGYYLAAVMLGERDILGREFELASGAPDIRAVFRSRPGSVKGTVDSGKPATAVLLPRDESLRDRHAISKALCQSDGRFEIGGLTPGDYYAWAFERFDVEALKDAAFVRTLLPRAATLHVNRGATATVALAITPWPE